MVIGWDDAAFAAVGFLKAMNKTKPVKYLNQSVGIGTALDNTASKNVFKMLDRYKEGKNRYKDYLGKNRFGEISKMTNTDTQAQATNAMANLYSNTKSTNANSNRQMLDSYMTAKNKSYFAASSKEAQQNAMNQQSLKANRFNQLRFLNATDASDNARADYGKALSRSFKYNQEDLEGVYKVS